MVAVKHVGFMLIVMIQVLFLMVEIMVKEVLGKWWDFYMSSAPKTVMGNPLGNTK
jgi:hypothetical protein